MINDHAALTLRTDMLKYLKPANVKTMKKIQNLQIEK